MSDRDGPVDAATARALTGLLFFVWIGCDPPPTQTSAPDAAVSPVAQVVAAAASPEPSPSRWEAERPSKMTLAGALGCEARVVGDWLRVRCVDRGDAKLGRPLRIDVRRGRQPGEGAQGDVLTADGGAMALVTPMRAGMDLEADFVWERETHALRVEWPAGRPVSERRAGFE